MNDSENLKIEELLTMLEQMQDQLDLEIAERSKAQEKISTLFSENSKLRSELQKKSETIVSLNEKIESLSKSDLQLKKSEVMMAKASKLKKEAEDKVSACNRRAEILAARESKVRDREENLDREIKNKAENMIKPDRQRLEWEYKSKASAITKKYDTMTKTYYVELVSLVIFSLIASLSQIWKEPVIIEDVTDFFSGLWNILLTGYGLAKYAGRNIAGVAEAINNPTASAIVYWVIRILVIATIIGAVVAGIVYATYRYVNYMKEHQWDRHTVIAVVADLAVTMFLAREISSVIPVNLILMQILLFWGYSGVRAWIQHSQGTQSYF